ncbi:hypothetical protein Glove_150g90 [Diversispora epigaea]|uniref:Uncharacterized protein n=1 Tax=Diversispora epigaea TaxID=1348612 RepID=A0A397IZS7_9GLOM|nr:hypothetical protein Glove_150g90 [Diversispora epigaea]
MAGFDIKIILDNKQRQFLNHLIYVLVMMKYVVSYNGKYSGNINHNEVFDNERLFDNLSIIKWNETPLQWSLRVRVSLQDLLNSKKYSFYHRYCLYMSYGKVCDPPVTRSLKGQSGEYLLPFVRSEDFLDVSSSWYIFFLLSF